MLDRFYLLIPNAHSRYIRVRDASVVTTHGDGTTPLNLILFYERLNAVWMQLMVKLELDIITNIEMCNPRESNDVRSCGLRIHSLKALFVDKSLRGDFNTTTEGNLVRWK